MAKFKFRLRSSASLCTSVNFRYLLRVYHVPGAVLLAGGVKMEGTATSLRIIVLWGTGYVGR